ncbi:MAG: ribonuclease Z [Thermodesulfobacteriota bacterium]|nr:ribonuclease Z [Thermodesulfobacteriota bacterium]
MRITFLGVGEACDSAHPNTSVLVETVLSGRERSVLCDCGFTVPHAYWKRVADPEALDAVWLSHFHGDHFMGLPLLLLRFWEMKRRRPLKIVGQSGIRDIAEQALDFAYPGFGRKLTYALETVEMEPGSDERISGFDWRTAESDHGRRNLSLRLEAGGWAVFYSGDGRPTTETLRLAEGCDLMIHEAFHVREPAAGHGTVAESLDAARSARARGLAVVHVQRDERREKAAEIHGMLKSAEGPWAFMPEGGETLILSSRAG